MKKETRPNSNPQFSRSSASARHSGAFRMRTTRRTRARARRILRSISAMGVGGVRSFGAVGCSVCYEIELSLLLTNHVEPSGQCVEPVLAPPVLIAACSFANVQDLKIRINHCHQVIGNAPMKFILNVRGFCCRAAQVTSSAWRIKMKS